MPTADQIAALYWSYLGRGPEPGDTDNWVNGTYIHLGATLAEITLAIATSDEAQLYAAAHAPTQGAPAGAVPTPAPIGPLPSGYTLPTYAQINGFYLQDLHRAASVDEYHGWLDGTYTSYPPNLAGIAQAIATSDEARAWTAAHPTPAPAPAPPAGVPTSIIVAPPPIIAPSPAPAAPTFYNLNIIVHASNTGLPVAGASVLLDQDIQNGNPRTTDSGGFVNFGVTPGTIQVAVSKAGYQTTAFSVLVQGDTEVDPVLTPGTSTPAPFVPGTPTATTPIGTPSASEPGGPSFSVDRLPLPTGAGLPPVQFDNSGGVGSIRPDFFVPPELAAGGGPYIGAIIIGISLLASLFGGGSSDTPAVDTISFRDVVLGLIGQIAGSLSLGFAIEGKVTSLVGKILSGVLGPLINAVAALVRGGSGDLSKLFGPISDLLKKAVATVRHLYNTWLRPIIRLIDVVRQFLRVAEAFHIKFASNIDQALGRLEGKLTAPILLTIGKVNELTNQVNKIVTLNGALQRAVLVQGLVKVPGCVTNLWWNSQTPTGISDGWQLDPVEDATGVPALTSNLRSLAYDDSGPYKGGFDEWIRNFRDESAAA